MDTMITVVGNLTGDPLQRVTASGATVVSLRVASSPRRFDRELQDWRDGDPMFINVSCWRQLAGNVMATLRKGDGVIVMGRLNLRSYDDKQGAKRSVHEIEAVSVGPDLGRYPAELRRPHRAADADAASASEDTPDGSPSANARQEAAA